MSESTMTTAQIIQFPSRRADAAEQGHERLCRAVAELNAAVVRQREVVAVWRGALAELGTVVSGLGTSLQRYQGSLDTLGQRVGRLHSQAVQLERTADAAIAAERG